MWNNNVKKGTIWTIKSLNEYEECYKGMKFGTYRVLIMSAFTTEDGSKIFTYLEIPNQKQSFNNYVEIKCNDRNYFVELNNIFTGDQRSLDCYIGRIDIDDSNKVIKAAKDYFNLHKQIALEDNITKQKIKEDPEIFQQRLFKYGIDVYVTENDNVKIKNKRILLSNEAKQDIIYNSKTEDDYRILCDKYQIYPIKAMHEIRSRLIYQHKQKEG